MQLNHDSASWNQYHNMPLVKHVVKLKTSAHHTHHHWSFNTRIVHISDSTDIVWYWAAAEDGNTVCDCILTWVVGAVAISNHCLTQNRCSLPSSFEQQLFAKCRHLHCILYGSYHIQSLLWICLAMIDGQNILTVILICAVNHDSQRRQWDFGKEATQQHMQIEFAELRDHFACRWGWSCYWRWWRSKDAAEEKAKGPSAFPHVCHGVIMKCLPMFFGPDGMDRFEFKRHFDMPRTNLAKDGSARLWLMPISLDWWGLSTQLAICWRGCTALTTSFHGRTRGERNSLNSWSWMSSLIIAFFLRHLPMLKVVVSFAMIVFMIRMLWDMHQHIVTMICCKIAISRSIELWLHSYRTWTKWQANIDVTNTVDQYHYR